MSSRIKILYLIDTNVPNVANGSNVALLNLIEEMKHFDIELMLVAAKYGSLCKDVEQKNIPYKLTNHECHVYPRVKSIKNAIFFVPRLLGLLIKNFKAELNLKTIVEKYKPDLIHTNIGQLHIGYNVAKRLNIPHVWHIREYQDLALGMHPIPSKKSFKNRLNSSNNYSIAITNGIFNYYNLSHNARVIYDGVLNKDDITFLENKSKYFLFLGRLNQQKGILELIKAFFDFASFNYDYNLLIAGDGSEIYVNMLKEIVNKTPYSNRIIFLGFRKDTSELLKNATALIVPSKYEGFGFVTVEAMFNGCLVVGNNSGGTKEILELNNSGILYSGHNELVQSLKDIVTLGIEYYYPMIKKAQFTATNLYSKEQNAIHIYNFYRYILNKNYDAKKDF